MSPCLLSTDSIQGEYESTKGSREPIKGSQSQTEEIVLLETDRVNVPHIGRGLEFAPIRLHNPGERRRPI